MPIPAFISFLGYLVGERENLFPSLEAYINFSSRQDRKDQEIQILKRAEFSSSRRRYVTNLVWKSTKNEFIKLRWSARNVKCSGSRKSRKDKRKLVKIGSLVYTLQFSFELESFPNHLVKLTVLGLKKKIITNSVFIGN